MNVIAIQRSLIIESQASTTIEVLIADALVASCSCRQSTLLKTKFVELAVVVQSTAQVSVIAETNR